MLLFSWEIINNGRENVVSFLCSYIFFTWNIFLNIDTSSIEQFTLVLKANVSP